MEAYDKKVAKKTKKEEFRKAMQEAKNKKREEEINNPKPVKIKRS
mgnify:CR=1 FL=1